MDDEQKLPAARADSRGEDTHVIVAIENGAMLEQTRHVGAPVELELLGHLASLLLVHSEARPAYSRNTIARC